MANEKSKALVTAIVVTIGTKNYINSCLDSLKKQSYPGLEIIVIDNSTNPGFSQELIKHYPEIKLYSSPQNLFYGQALNKGLETSEGDFVLCLNDDVVLNQDFIKNALRGFEIDSKIGMVSGKILRSDGKTLDSAGLYPSLWRTAKERGYSQKDVGQFEREGYIFGVSGAAAFYRKKMLEDIKEETGYFDYRMRMFYEDLDVAWRAQRQGWKGYYTPGALAHHMRGASVRETAGISRPYARRFISDELCAEFMKNRYLMMIKNESLLGHIWHLPLILVYDFMDILYFTFKKPNVLKIFFKNTGVMIKGLLKRLKK